MRFHVLTDANNKLTMQSQRNVVKGVAWYADVADNSNGPTTIVPALETATNGWGNVNTLNTTYPSATAKCTLSGNTTNCTTGYPNYVRSENKSRLITLTEATSTNIGNCSSIHGSCKKFMYNYLSDATSFGASQQDNTIDNEGYWTSSTDVDDGALAWAIAKSGTVFKLGTSNSALGARAVVEINK